MATIAKRVKSKSSSHLILSPENILRWFKEAVYQTFLKNIAIKCYKNAEREVNNFKTKQAESKHFCFWYLVGKWNLKKIAKDEFASSSINIRKRIQDLENRLRFAKCVKTSLKPNNELNKFIKAIISSDLEQLPKINCSEVGTSILILSYPLYITIMEVSEEIWLTDTIHQFLESAVCDIPGLICATLLRHLGNEENRKSDRTVRLKLEDNQN
ncbi:18825_t:CDS:2, partial [Racocetra persica]